MQVNTYDPNNPLSTTGADPNIYQQLPSQNRFGTSHIPGQSTANASAAMDLMCPAFDRPDAEKIAWLQGSVARGRNFLSQQPVAPFIDLATKILMGMEVEGDGGMVQKDGTPSKRRSTSRINEISRMILEVVDNMHNLKPKWFYEMLGGDVDANKKFQQVVNQMNARLAVWWTGSTFPATKIKEALQQAATASGYLIPVWTKELFGSGDEDVELKVAGPQDVIPDGITDDWDLQKAQAVHIYERCPTARLRALWWEQAQFILPTTPLGADNSVRGNGMLPSGMRGFMNFASSSLFSALGMSGFASDKQATTGMGRMVQTKLGLTSFPVTDLYISYLQDSTVNTSGRVVWANEFTRTDTAHGLNLVRDYPVPPNGVPVRIHNSEEAKTNPYFSDDQSSLRHPKQYTYTDCMLYPTRRMLIWTVDRVLYDGPNFDHHGQVPAIKIDLRHWTWSYLGTGLVRQNISPQAGMTSLLRGMLDSVNLKLKPPLKVKRGAMTATELQRKDWREPGQVIEYDGKYGDDAISSLLQPDSYNADQNTLAIIQFLQQSMNRDVGTSDLSWLSKLNQVPDANGIEKMMQAMGPLLSGYASHLEKALTALGYQLFWLWLQYDTTSRRLRINGPSNVLDTELDWQPGNLVPGYIEEADELHNSCFMRRLRYVGKRITFHISAGSLFDVTDWKQRMAILQLSRESNMKIPSSEIAKAFGLKGYGEFETPDGDKTWIARWMAEQKMAMQFQGNLQTETMQRTIVSQAVAAVQAQAAQQQVMMMLQQEGSLDPATLGLVQALMAGGAGGGGAAGGAGGMGAQGVDPAVATQLLQQLLAQTGTAQGLGNGPGGAGLIGAVSSREAGRPSSGQQPPELETRDGGTRTIVSESR